MPYWMYRVYFFFKFTIPSFKYEPKRLWYRLFYGVRCDSYGSYMADMGKGKFVDVLRNGPYIEITSHRKVPLSEPGTIRIVPCQYNHGVWIEYQLPNGNIGGRIGLDYDKLYQMFPCIYEHIRPTKEQMKEWQSTPESTQAQKSCS